MMNVQSLETTRRRVELYRQTMRDTGHDDAAIAGNLAASWVWRNVFVAETDAEAERVGVPAFETMTRDRAEMRDRIFADTGLRIAVPHSDLPGARTARGDGLIHGSPARVAEDFAALDRLGIGGVINTFPPRPDAARGRGGKPVALHARSRAAVPGIGARLSATVFTRAAVTVSRSEKWVFRSLCDDGSLPLARFTSTKLCTNFSNSVARVGMISDE